MAVPSLTPEQRAAGLKKAAEARAKRVELKAGLKDGSVTLADVFASDDNVVKRTRIRDVLLALPGFGKVRVERTLKMCGVASNPRVSCVGARQREMLLDCVS